MNIYFFLLSLVSLISSIAGTKLSRNQMATMKSEHPSDSGLVSQPHVTFFYVCVSFMNFLYLYAVPCGIIFGFYCVCENKKSWYCNMLKLINNFNPFSF